MGPLDGINNNVCSAKLHPMAVLADPVDCDCWCRLLDTCCCCMSPNGTLNAPLVFTHLRHWYPPPLVHPLICAIRDITVAVKKATQNPAVLAS